MKKILFVCLGNICRSPAGQALAGAMASERNLQLQVDSCGIGKSHIGHLPDKRMREAAMKRGIEILKRASLLQENHFRDYDLLLAADKSIFEYLQKNAPSNNKAKVIMMTKYSERYPNEDVPDPFYGEQSDFEFVLDMLEESIDKLLINL